MGRPLAPIDEEELTKLALAGAKNAELAAYFGVDEATIGTRFSKILTKIRSVRRMNLRGAQTEKAMSGDATMMIWLGKNELEQTDKVEQQHSGGITIQVVYEDIDPNSKTAATEPAPYEPQGRPSPLL